MSLHVRFCSRELIYLPCLSYISISSIVSIFSILCILSIFSISSIFFVLAILPSLSNLIYLIYLFFNLSNSSIYLPTYLTIIYIYICILTKIVIRKSVGFHGHHRNPLNNWCFPPKQRFSQGFSLQGINHGYFGGCHPGPLVP